MKSFSIILACLTVSATFSVMSAFGAESTDCKNIVQSTDAKPVSCDPSKGACPAAPAVKVSAGQNKAS